MQIFFFNFHLRRGVVDRNGRSQKCCEIWYGDMVKYVIFFDKQLDFKNKGSGRYESKQSLFSFTYLTSNLMTKYL